jgi:acetyl-CoA acetyltransferase
MAKSTGRFPRPVAVAAVSDIPSGRYPDHDALGMYRIVLQKFLNEWNIKPSDIQGILAAPAGQGSLQRVELYTHEKIAEELGVTPYFADTMNAGGGTFGIMVQRAALAVATEQVDSVLCIGSGKFAKVTQRSGEIMSKMTCHPEFEWIYGPSVVGINAMAATLHMATYGTTQAQLARVAVSQRMWALRNPNAITYRKGPLTVQDVLQSPLISSPFHLYHCSIPCEGGGAVLVASEEIARRLNPQAAYILGMGECLTHASISQSPARPSQGARVSSRRAYEMAGVSPSEIDVAELYDGFVIHPLLFVEDLGLCEEGEGGRFYEEGRADPGGDMPVNTYGGLCSSGHPGDASGICMIIEGARQVMNRAGARQVENVKLAIVHSFGGMLAHHSTLILGRES